MPATQAEAGFWVDKAAAVQASRARAATTIAQNRWRAFSTWYDAAAVAALATQIDDLSQGARDAVAGAMQAYVAHLSALIRDTSSIPVPRASLPAIRNGVDMVGVHSRPAAQYRWTYAITADQEAALEAALLRTQQLIETDVMLAARDAQHAAMEDIGVHRYRRVLRPELAKSGHSCGLCAVASHRVYKTGELMPIHGGCNCLTIEVTADDPGSALNKADLDRIYSAASEDGSTHARDLKRVQVQINEHGELGPVLTVRGQHFLGKRAASNRTQESAQKTLSALLTNLDTFMAAKAGQDVIGYQQRQIARLRAAA